MKLPKNEMKLRKNFPTPPWKIRKIYGETSQGLLRGNRNISEIIKVVGDFDEQL